MTNSWYELASSDNPLTQGDLIFDCPVSVWKKVETDSGVDEEIEILKSSIDFVSADVVVMTQACDLENNNISNITLCPHISVLTYKKLLKENRESRGLTLNSGDWKKFLKELKNGTRWDKSLLNSFENDEKPFDHRIVDFYEVYTIPRNFLETLIEDRGKPRPRLLAPYREHLSQAFARFYMRVGLPTPINKI